MYDSESCLCWIPGSSCREVDSESAGSESVSSTCSHGNFSYKIIREKFQEPNTDKHGRGRKWCF